MSRKQTKPRCRRCAGCGGDLPEEAARRELVAPTEATAEALPEPPPVANPDLVVLDVLDRPSLDALEARGLGLGGMLPGAAPSTGLPDPAPSNAALLATDIASQVLNRNLAAG